MKQIFQDKYILGQSVAKAIEKIGQEIRIDLSLVPNPNNNNNGSIYGKVTDVNGNIIESALVKIMSDSYEPLMHDITDSNGTYSFTNIPANVTYNIFAISAKMKLQQLEPIFIGESQSLELNFVLEMDPALSFSIIAGDIINPKTNKPVDGAVVALFRKRTSSEEDLKAIVYTNEYGQYVFREIEKGSYVVRIGALGYNSTSIDVLVTGEGQIIPMKIALTEDPLTSRGTVSGIITDDNNQPINRADVILYKVEDDESLSPVSFTKTNESGIYLFANVPEGNYKVKSNQIEIVSINVQDPSPYAPNFIGFRVESSYGYTYIEDMLKKGIIENGAKVNDFSGYIENIGGRNNGSATIKINAPIEGEYNLAIRYLSGDNNRPLMAAINKIHEYSFTLLKTDNWDIGSARIFNTIVKLNKGENSIKFYNNTAEYAPHILHVGLTALPFEEVYELSDIKVFGKAKVEDKVVKNIGKGLGYIVLDIDVPYTRLYNFVMRYVANNKNNKCHIELNESSTKELYTFNATDSLNYKDYSEKIISLPLKKGKNKIKIHNK